MIRAFVCVSCGTPLNGRQRKYCSKRCGVRRRVRVFRGTELSDAASLRYTVVELDSDIDSGGSAAFGVACSYDVAEILNEEIARFRHLR